MSGRKVIDYYSNRNSKGEGYATESGVSSITNDLANIESISNNIPKSQKWFLFGIISVERLK